MKSLFSIFCMLALTVLTVSGQEADTTIVLNYGPMPVGNITVSKSSATYRQVKEAEAVVEGLTDQKAKNRAVVSYVLSHPDSEGSVLLLNHVAGVSNGRKCLSAISEQARSGLMKPLYDAFSDGIKEFDTMAAKTREAIVIGKEAKDFTLEDLSGKMLTLSSLRGKYVFPTSKRSMPVTATRWRCWEWLSTTRKTSGKLPHRSMNCLGSSCSTPRGRAAWRKHTASWLLQHTC